MTSKFLIVDDEPPVRELMQMVLTDASYSVILSSNGAGAIEKNQREKPDLVLDIVMPEKKVSALGDGFLQ